MLPMDVGQGGGRVVRTDCTNGVICRCDTSSRGRPLDRFQNAKYARSRRSWCHPCRWDFQARAEHDERSVVPWMSRFVVTVTITEVTKLGNPGRCVAHRLPLRAEPRVGPKLGADRCAAGRCLGGVPCAAADYWSSWKTCEPAIAIIGRDGRQQGGSAHGQFRCVGAAPSPANDYPMGWEQVAHRLGLLLCPGRRAWDAGGAHLGNVDQWFGPTSAGADLYCNS